MSVSVLVAKRDVWMAVVGTLSTENSGHLETITVALEERTAKAGTKWTNGRDEETEAEHPTTSGRGVSTFGCWGCFIPTFFGFSFNVSFVASSSAYSNTCRALGLQSSFQSHLGLSQNGGIPTVGGVPLVSL